MFIDCPAWMNQKGTVNCGLPAEVLCRYIMTSSDGPVESAMIRCPSGHWFNGPIEFFVLEIHHQPNADAYHNPTTGR